MLIVTHEDSMQKQSQLEICQRECHPGFKVNQQHYLQDYWNISATLWLFPLPIEPRVSPEYSSWKSHQPWAWFGTLDTHAVYWHILICTPIKEINNHWFREESIIYAYLAERVTAFCDEGLGKFAHADGTVVLLKDLIHTDLDLLAHLPYQLRLLHHFYHIYFSIN